MLAYDWLESYKIQSSSKPDWTVADLTLIYNGSNIEMLIAQKVGRNLRGWLSREKVLYQGRGIPYVAQDTLSCDTGKEYIYNIYRCTG